jgi:hypothetical protein
MAGEEGVMSEVIQTAEQLRIMVGQVTPEELARSQL